MKIGDLVRYTSTGDDLGVGIVLNIFANNTGQECWDHIEVVWSGNVKWPIRQISRKWLEVINESR